VVDTVLGMGVVMPYPMIACRGWVGGIVSVEHDGSSRLANPLSAAYYFLTLFLQLTGYSLAASYQAGLIGVHVSRNGADLGAERVWVNKAAAMNSSSPVAVGHHLYGLGPAKNLVCVEAGTGKLAWSRDGYFTTSAEVAHASFLAMGDNLLVFRPSGQRTSYTLRSDIAEGSGDGLQSASTDPAKPIVGELPRPVF
jgi:hypothetical protein